MKFYCRLLFTSFLFVLFLVASSFAFGGGEKPAGAAPELGRDLAVTLQIPLFDPEFGAVPVASLGSKELLLKDLTPSLKAAKEILFWDFETSSEELSGQLKQAIDTHIQQEQIASEQVLLFADMQVTEGQQLRVHAPLFSDSFANVPVATIDDVPITVAEFARDLQAVHSSADAAEQTSGAMNNIQRLMKRLITVRLVEREARNIGFDQTNSFQKQTAAFAEKTLLYGLLNMHASTLVLDETEAEEMYRKISLEAKLQSYRLFQQDVVTGLQKALENGEDFDSLISNLVAKGKAVAEQQQGYLKFTDLLPNIANEANVMEIGGVSQAFRQADGFVIFKLEDRRFVEDPNALNFSRKKVWEQQRAIGGTTYINETIDLYAEFDTDVEKALDFSKLQEGNPKIKLGDALQPLLEDKRVLVRVAGAEPDSVTVADLVQKILDTYFHGLDVGLNVAEVEKKKSDILTDTLFRMAGTLEAQKLGLDQRADYLREIEEFERRTLFDIFMQKVITPDIRLTEEEIRGYYDAHQKDYQTPTMFKLKSLPFYREADAQDAVNKLNSGSDFNWVSANVEGRVGIQDENLLKFDSNILSLTALPGSLQDQAAKAQRGQSLLYEEPDSFYYVLYFENVYPAEPKSYDQVRKEILELAYQEKVTSTLDEWVIKLKEVYETKVFLVAESR